MNRIELRLFCVQQNIDEFTINHDGIIYYYINLGNEYQFYRAGDSPTNYIDIIEADATFVAIIFPNVQELMTEEGFDDNSMLINDEPLLVEFGMSAYMVRKSWLNKYND